MKIKTTFRSFNGSIYVRIPPGLVEYFNLTKLILKALKDGIEPECKIEDTSEDSISVTFPKWG